MPPMNLRTLFSEHPASVGENYFQHLGNALWFSTRMLTAGVACLVHAIFPFLFVKTGSKAITQLYDRMVLHRSKIPAQGSVSSQTLS